MPIVLQPLDIFDPTLPIREPKVHLGPTAHQGDLIRAPVEAIVPDAGRQMPDGSQPLLSHFRLIGVAFVTFLQRFGIRKENVPIGAEKRLAEIFQAEGFPGDVRFLLVAGSRLSP